MLRIEKYFFLDELQWINTPKSNFISGLEHYWNAWASARKDILLIICGSATSWIVNKLINNRGGLHNRITNKIKLNPFMLSECEQFAKANCLEMSRYQMVECYMIIGGVPFYWSLLKKELSMAQNIDALFFNPDAEGLTHEYDQLYASLFTHPESYIQIVEALANKNKGLTRDEIIRVSGMPTGSNLTRYLDGLKWCRFIRKHNCIGEQS